MASQAPGRRRRDLDSDGRARVQGNRERIFDWPAHFSQVTKLCNSGRRCFNTAVPIRGGTIVALAGSIWLIAGVQEVSGREFLSA